MLSWLFGRTPVSASTTGANATPQPTAVSASTLRAGEVTTYLENNVVDLQSSDDDRTSMEMPEGVSEEIVNMAIELGTTSREFFVQEALKFPPHVRFHMSAAQQAHAIELLRRAPAFSNMRYDLCPKQMGDPRFWLCYFQILKMHNSSSKQATKANDTMKEQKAAEQLMEDILFVKDSVFANLKPRIRKGGLQRSKVWSCITGCSLYLHENPKVFQDVLLEFFDSPTLQSGLPSVSFNELFREEDHQMDDEAVLRLQNILFIIAKHSYPEQFLQYIPDLVAILVRVLPAESAFVVLRLLLYQARVHGQFLPATVDIYKQWLGEFDSQVKTLFPVLYAKMASMNIYTSEFSARWFNRFFVGTLPLSLVFRIFDCFLNEGRRVLNYTACAILFFTYPLLMEATSPATFLESVSTFPPDFTEPAFLTVTFSFLDTGRPPELSSRHLYDLPEVFPSQLLTKDQVISFIHWHNPLSLLPYGNGFRSALGYWNLVYSSLHQKYNCAPTFIADQLELNVGHYYGTGETKYAWSPKQNRYYLLVESEQLACGGGGDVPGYGLVIDDELHYGSSIRCGTFDNEPLNAGKEHFECVHLEVIAQQE